MYIYIWTSSVCRKNFALSYTQKNLFEILLNQPEIRLCLPFSNWFGSKPTSILIKINRKMVNTNWFRVDLIRFWKEFSVCMNLKECLTYYYNLDFSGENNQLKRVGQNMTNQSKLTFQTFPKISVWKLVAVPNTWQLSQSGNPQESRGSDGWHPIWGIKFDL